MHVEKVTVTVTLSNGDTMTINDHDPKPVGDNPAFLKQ